MIDEDRSVLRFPRRRLASCTIALLACLGAARAAEPLPTVDQATAGLERLAGMLTLYRDPDRGKLWLELPPGSGPRGEIGRYLYVESLRSGLGSNPVGLDRGQLGSTRLIVLRRVGGSILVEQPNLAFRATSASEREREAVEQSFATSVLWAGEITARDADGRQLVDFSSFVVRDAHDVVRRLAETKQGEFSLDRGRSAIDLQEAHAFVGNVELEAVLTYAHSRRGGDAAGATRPGAHVRSVTPLPQAITLVQHHSILRLPDPGYRPRDFDPRAGSFHVDFLDYATPLDARMERRWIVRHRLEKVDPRKQRSRVREPLVYYVDPGTPEPVRSALIEGASWWAQAFDAAGFIDAFRVELLPDDAHPLDASYNVIQWVHRATRGWSYGGGVVDPRTGEMIKAHVSLGSLRVRQDRILFEGLAGTSATGSGAPDDPVQLALARLRQLSAHEVGHTLGLGHNFAASTYGRASVMDYPAPRVGIDEAGELDFAEAYAVGVGSWDVQAIRYAYSQFPPDADESARLAEIVADGLARELIFLSDPDARPAGAAHPLANLWDNGDDPLAELDHVLRVREVALRGFGERSVAMGSALAHLEEVLGTVYFHHRYQLDAAMKSVGGLDYRYALRGDGQPTVRPVAAPRQRLALERVLRALTVDQLDVGESVLELLPPRPSGFGASREQFGSHTAPAFDALGAAATGARMVVDGLLQSQRCARLVDFHRRDPELPGLEEVLDALVAQAFDVAESSPRRRAIGHAVQQVVVDGLIALSSDVGASAAVRGRVDGALARLLARLAGMTDAARDDSAQAAFLAGAIRRYLERPHDGADRFSVSAPPPGSPIGDTLAGCSRDH